MYTLAEYLWPFRTAKIGMIFTVLVVVTAFASFDTSASSVGNNIVTPIQNFEPSWTASSVGGTTIAIPFTLKDISSKQQQNDDSSSNAVVVVFRTTRPSSSSTTGDSFNTDGSVTNQRTKRSDSSSSVSGLDIVGPIYTTSDAITLSQSSQRWTFLGSTAICSMTGFSPDIDYLTRYLQKMVDNYRKTYESTSTSKTTLISPMKLVDSLAEELQEAGQWQGGRPFGVQALIIGRDSVIEKASSLNIFTLDPSGGYRQWRGGTAIGRNGKIIRDRLFDFCISENSMNGFHTDNGAEALCTALQVSILSRTEESEKLERFDMYEAILLWQSKDEFCAAHVDTNQINEMRESILTKQKGKSI